MKTIAYRIRYAVVSLAGYGAIVGGAFLFWRWVFRMIMEAIR